MIFNQHSELEGRHAFLSPSQYHWINYTEEKLISVYTKHLAVERGEKLHELAKMLIDLKQPLPREKLTLNMYVNDCLDFKMQAEQPLKYSDNCFGRADAISFRRKKLRVFDLKTGYTPAHMEQLEAYAALFCLEYKVKPKDISIELRIYQDNDILFKNPSGELISNIMDIIVRDDKIIEKIKCEMEN